MPKTEYVTSPARLVVAGDYVYTSDGLKKVMESNTSDESTIIGFTNGPTVKVPKDEPLSIVPMLAKKPIPSLNLGDRILSITDNEHDTMIVDAYVFELAETVNGVSFSIVGRSGVMRRVFTPNEMLKTHRPICEITTPEYIREFAKNPRS